MLNAGTPWATRWRGCRRTEHFHGEAVAAGLLWESATAVAQGYLAKAELAPVAEALAKLGFFPVWRAFSPESVFLPRRGRQKNRAGMVAYVPLGSVGRPALPPPHVAELTLDLRAGFRLGKA